jgi:hypothetical protein
LGPAKAAAQARNSENGKPAAAMNVAVDAMSATLNASAMMKTATKIRLAIRIAMVLLMSSSPGLH